MNLKLMNEYYKATDKLNEVNPNFSSFYYEMSDNKDDIYNFTDYCSYFKKVTKLIVKESSYYGNLSRNFPFEIFSYDNIKNNLIYLELQFRNATSITNFCEKLKDLKVLEELRLDNILFFHLEINTIKYIYFSNCHELKIAENCCPNLKIINLFETNIKKIENNLKFPELEKFKVSFSTQQFRDIIDFKSLIKLKYLIRININDFLDLGNTLLEKVYINNHCGSGKESEIKMMKKLIEIKTLKEIKIDISYISNDDIESIKGENTSVEKLIINWENHNNYYYTNFNYDYKEIILYSFQKKFPNLKEFEIYINDLLHVSHNNDSSILEITPSSNCKINKFKYAGVENENSSTIFYIAPYEDLVSVEFGCMKSSFKLEDSFPLFNEKCNSIFKSLINFKFDTTKEIRQQKDIDLKIIKNLINNLNKMPNLKFFIFKVRCRNMDEITYKKFIEELLLLNIKNIELSINNNMTEYSKDELKDIYKGIDFDNFEKIIIKKI